MHTSGFFPSSMISFLCSQASKTSIHLSYVGSSRKQRKYFCVVVDTLFPRKGQRYSCMSFCGRAIGVIVSECRRSANIGSNYNDFQNFGMEE